MRTQRSFLTIVAVGLLTGCNSPLISAEPLVISPADLAAAENGGNKKAFLGRLIFQSEQKCTAFLNELVASIGGINSIGDIVSGALSGVAAFTTPVAASHVLSGTATIVTGAKSALNADFYARSSIANFESAVQQSYFANIGKYAADLETQSDATLVAAIEVGKIQTFHASCGIGPAEAAIAATVAPPGTGSGPGGIGGESGEHTDGYMAGKRYIAPQTPYMVPGSRLH